MGDDQMGQVDAGGLGLFTVALGLALVERYHGEEVACEEDEWFTDVFSRRSAPEDVPTVAVESLDVPLLDILKRCMPSESLSSLRRLVGQGGVRVGDNKLTDTDQVNAVFDGDVLRAGKRKWFRIVAKY